MGKDFLHRYVLDSRTLASFNSLLVIILTQTEWPLRAVVDFAFSDSSNTAGLDLFKIFHLNTVDRVSFLSFVVASLNIMLWKRYFHFS